MTPAMQQFLDIKSEYQEHLVLFRMGDFYETFYEDAKISSQILGITLTARDKERKVPMAGIPYHALDNYLSKLIEANQKVVLVEQLEDPKQAKGVVKRGIVKIFTPGTSPITKDLKKNIFICSIDASDNQFKIFFTDLDEGEIKYAFFDSEEELLNNIILLDSREILLSKENIFSEKFIKQLNIKGKLLSYLKQEFYNEIDLSKKNLNNSFTKQINKISENSLNALVNYLIETQRTELSHLNNIQEIKINKFLKLDSSAIQNLELLEGQRKDSVSLFQIIDNCCTNSGSKLLRNWLQRPLLDVNEIKNRQDIIYNFRELGIDNINILRDILCQLSDLNRIASRIGLQNANARDLRSLVSNFSIVFDLISKLKQLNLIDNIHFFIQEIERNIQSSQELLSQINTIIVDEPPFSIREGGMVKDGFSKELDEYRSLKTGGKEWLKNFEQDEIKKTRISTLKVRFNKVFGYYIEISKGQSDKAPDSYIRKQTLVNAERYITPELKEYEVKVLSAEDNIRKLEFEIFSKLLDSSKSLIPQIQNIALLTAEIDCLLNLSFVSIQNKWNKPEVNEDFEISIEGGRHPVIEELMKKEGKPFVKNNYLSNNECSLHLITGPNMGGKSTYLRQNALIVILAQIGSFVPADNAKIGITDKIFTRVGASDNLSAGESTFMVEMLETSNILKNATKKSFVILDEVGRGTSTFDGMSLAWAICEYIGNLGCRTLFATHYHELTELSNKYSNIKNLAVKVVEFQNEIVFMHQIMHGRADRSYGIHVAKLAGIPSKVINNAEKVLKLLEKEKNKLQPKPQDLFSSLSEEKNDNSNIPIEIKEKLSNVDINKTSPIEALQILNDLKGLINN